MFQLHEPVPPLLSYYGGKQRIASRIVKLLPRHTVYVEPFAGGAAVLFAKGRPTGGNAGHYSEVLNDSDQRLMTFYRVLQERPLALIRRLWATPFSEAEHIRSHQILKTWHEHDEMTQAWAYYVNIQQSFANKLNAGWGRGVWGQHMGQVWKHKNERLWQGLRRFAGVNLSCTDAVTCIQQWDAPQTCFYCDPPYVGTNLGHYKGYTLGDYRALLTALANAQGSFVLSGYDVPEVTMPTEWQRVEIQAVMSSSGKGKVNGDRTRKATAVELGDRQRTEVLWICDRSQTTMRPDVQAIFAKLYPTQQQLNLL